MPVNGTTDILGRKPQVVGRAYSSDSFNITVSGANDHDFMLIQNLNFTYGQSVTRLFDLENAEFQAYVSARPQGTMTMANVVTNLSSLVSFMQRYGDVCSADDPKTMTISLSRREGGSLCKAEQGALVLSYPVLVNAAMGIAVADYIVTNTMEFIFASASVDGERDTSSSGMIV